MGRGLTAFFEFFEGGVMVLRVLWRYSAEESWVDNVLQRRGSLPEGFSSEGFSPVRHSVGAWVFVREMG
uniref:Uncharacterized protein n=1 Tax=Cucumis melo TaxID=3656 RepID=A0A9I9EIA3_CUCME